MLPPADFRLAKIVAEIITTKFIHSMAKRFRQLVVCYTAVFSVVTQRSSPLTAAENRTTFLSRD